MTQRERAVVSAGAVVAALHTVIDSFVAPDRGTAWSDHLAGGLAPLVLLAVAAAVYTRLRPGARATLAASLGALSLTGAALAVADARATFSRGSDWTGFLLAPTGIALLLLSSALLWQSRRGGPRRHLRRTLFAVAAAAGAYWLVVPVALALVATHRPRAERAAVGLAYRPLAYRPVELRTADGLTLSAAYARSRNGAAVLLFPTRGGHADHARLLRRHGYGVLLVDMRGYDGSEGSPNAFGWGATRDVDAAVDWLGRQQDVRGGRIGALGLSVGGEQVLEAAAGNGALRAVVAEGAGERSVRETWLRGVRAAFAMPEAVVQTTAVALFSQTAPPPSLRDVVARIGPRATFLIYAGRGGGGEELTPSYFRAAAQPKQVWRIAAAGHTGGLDAVPHEYERRVVGFFDRYLLGRSGAGVEPTQRRVTPPDAF